LAYSNVIDYNTILTTGNSADFGDLTIAVSWHTACCDETRAVMAGGHKGSVTDEIDYLTIATTGNAVVFGDLITSKYAMGACSGSTRAVWAGADGGYEVIQYVTIQTTGNAVDFGDLTGNIAASTGTAA